MRHTQAMSLVKSFLPDDVSRRLLSGFVIFCVVCAGGALCYVGSALSIRWLYRVGFGIGVVGAIVLVLHVWWRLFIGTEESESAPETQQDEQSPH